MATGIHWNPALDALPFSPIRKIFNKAAGMDDVIHLSIGQPDFGAPEHIAQALVKAVQDGHVRYEMDAGLPALREAIAAYYADAYDISLTSQNVLVTTGCVQAIYMALTAVIAPGRELVVVEPAFVLQHIGALAGGKIRYIITTADNGYQVDPNEVIAAFNDNTAAVLLNSPGNPTGAIYPRQTMEAICTAAAQRGITVISDEVYDRLILDDQPFPSALTCTPDMEHLLMTSSASKTYAVPGLRIGWLISTPQNIEVLQRYHMYASCVENTPAQHAVTAALTGPQECVAKMVAAYRDRRNRLVQLLDAIPQLTGYSPGGAFFIMPSMPTGSDSFDIADRMLDEIKVCTVPGGGFGDSCNNALRISYATSMEQIETALERMTSWFSQQSF